MWQSPRRAKKRWPIWAGAVVLLAVIVLAARGATRFGWLSSLLTTVWTPVQTTAQNVVNRVSGYFSNRIYMRDLEQEYVKLAERVDELEMENSQMHELMRENEALKALLGYAETVPQYDMLGAQIIGRNTEIWFADMTINRGSAHGVQEYDTVVCPQGLVGHVVQVNRNTSVVRTIVDGQSAVGGVVESNRITGIVRGNLQISGEGDPCRMVYLPYEAELVPGDRVLTSGLEGIFPKGFLIGVVTDVSRGRQSTDAYVVVRPAADLRRLENVLVILSEEKPSEDEATPTETGQ